MSKKLEDEAEGLVDRRNLLKGAAFAGLGAMTIGATGAAAASGTTAGAKTGTSGSIQDLVQKMAGDAEFAEAVIAEPSRYQAEYNLSRRAVSTLRGLLLEDFSHLRVEDPKAFAAGAITSATLARTDFTVKGDSCYYFG